ncbi:hypothetical protein [Isoptericola variabilis]|uniref:Uncharacterized protein n=1 Tax=Isoptericola variabilis (strain 225) TaxID=743718 RepID=F6FPR0_ISOV2|nr:hypothetical protein [Isoptericola variabilis]AEG44792.1 hypothetical protein Isova_2061 [Isoptericola variabilis 225]TWH30679.1 hypothetical protein L600_002900000110 [Isoptericola variabilis J7]
MLHTAVQIAQEATEQAPTGAFELSPVVLGVLAFGALVAMLLVTYAFRNVGSRH